MIIDCHGHYTTTPPQVGVYREKQVAAVAEDPSFIGEKGQIVISDDEIRESIVNNQLRLQQERGTDLTIFSPRASWMGHHIGNEYTSQFWSEHQNDLIRRVCDLFPNNFVPVAQLPQSPGVDPAKSVPEIVRTVEQMGFIGINLNPDRAAATGTVRRWQTVPSTRSTRRWSSTISRRWFTLARPAMAASTPPARITSAPIPPVSSS